MIRVTNKARDFFESRHGEIIIYGAGNAGYWIGRYMNLCGMEFAGYIDGEVKWDDVFYNRKPVYRPDKLKEYANGSVRIIVSAHCYQSILYELQHLTELYKINALCMVPEYVFFTDNKKNYDINRFLAYFRRKIFVGDMPTIISSECSDGLIYYYMDALLQTPTVNTAFSYEDYLKLCYAPEKYLKSDVEELSWVRPFHKNGGVERYPLGKIKDIYLLFAHTDTMEGLADRWALLRKKINWNNIVFLLVAREKTVPLSALRAFSRVPRKHLTIFEGNAAYIPDDFKNYLFIPGINLFDLKNEAIENYFDLVGWLNDVSDGTGNENEYKMKAGKYENR